MPINFFASNGQQEINSGHLEEVFEDTKTPAIITLNTCDIKPVSFKYSPENQSTKKTPRGIV